MTRTAARGGGRTTALLALLWMSWVLVPLGLAGAGVAATVTFLGEMPTSAEEAQADRLLVAAALTAIAVALVGFLVSSWADRRVSAVGFCVALALGLLAAVPVFHATAPDPAPIDPGGGGCQERSGYPNDCPGG